MVPGFAVKPVPAYAEGGIGGGAGTSPRLPLAGAGIDDLLPRALIILGNRD